MKTSQLFNLESYYHSLKTAKLGRPCKYLDKVSSTLDVAPREKPYTLVLAREQTNGRGQRTNVWESLVGCAMGTIRIECPRESWLAKRVCFLQHILAMSAAQTLEKIDPQLLGREHIALKWPNDILYIKDHPPKKLAGVLVHTKDTGDVYDITLSFGLNVDNRQPTTCINEILGQTQRSVSIDSVVADMMNNLESNTDELNEIRFKQIKQDYESRCLQMGQVVLDEKVGTVRVTGVNEDGYLVGHCETSKKPCCVTRII